MPGSSRIIELNDRDLRGDRRKRHRRFRKGDVLRIHRTTLKSANEIVQEIAAGHEVRLDYLDPVLIVLNVRQGATSLNAGRGARGGVSTSIPNYPKAVQDILDGFPDPIDDPNEGKSLAEIINEGQLNGQLDQSDRVIIKSLSSPNNSLWSMTETTGYFTLKGDGKYYTVPPDVNFAGSSNWNVEFTISGYNSGNLVFASDNTKFLLKAASGSSSTAINAFAGTIAVYVDNVLFNDGGATLGTRGELFTLLSDGASHNIRMVGCNLAGWDQFVINNLATFNPTISYRSLILTDVTNNPNNPFTYNGYGRSTSGHRDLLTTGLEAQTWWYDGANPYRIPANVRVLKGDGENYEVTGIDFSVITNATIKLTISGYTTGDFNFITEDNTSGPSDFLFLCDTGVSTAVYKIGGVSKSTTDIPTYIDGNLQPNLTTRNTIRNLIVDGGEHDVEFRNVDLSGFSNIFINDFLTVAFNATYALHPWSIEDVTNGNTYSWDGLGNGLNGTPDLLLNITADNITDSVRELQGDTDNYSVAKFIENYPNASATSSFKVTINNYTTGSLTIAEMDIVASSGERIVLIGGGETTDVIGNLGGVLIVDDVLQDLDTLTRNALATLVRDGGEHTIEVIGFNASLDSLFYFNDDSTASLNRTLSYSNIQLDFTSSVYDAYIAATTRSYPDQYNGQGVSTSGGKDLIYSGGIAMGGSVPIRHGQWKGFLGDGAQGYIGWGYNPFVDGVNLILNSARGDIGVYENRDIRQNKTLLGGYDGSMRISLIQQPDNTRFIYRMNMSGSGLKSSANGLFLEDIEYGVGREDGVTAEIFISGVEEGSVASASGTVLAVDLHSLSDNNNGTPDSFLNARISYGILGGGFDLVALKTWTDSIKSKFVR